MNDEKKFLKPTASIVEFDNDDIITQSLTDGITGLDWGDDDNHESMF